MSADRLTVEYLTGVLRPAGPGRITEVRASPLGNGQLADSAHVRIRWEPAGAGPGSLVAKVASATARRRRVAAATRAYEIEAGFYTDLAPRLSVRVPRCHAVRYRRDPLDYCLVMEDLTALRPGDQLIGCSVDAAAAALEELARLHAGSRSRRTRMGWLRPTGGNEYAERRGRLVSTLGPRFIERYGSHLDDTVIAATERFAARAARYGEGARTPETVVHGDFRADNLLFGPGRVAVLDWQTVSLSPALSDVAYFLGTSLTPDVRRRAERDLLRHYRRCAGAYGLAIGWDDCWNDYRRFACAGLMMAITAATLVAQSDRDTRMFALLAERSAWQAIDLGTEPPK
jgi:hypothetical protein